MSPASGDFYQLTWVRVVSTQVCFHSINVPSEWGPGYKFGLWLHLQSFHSINVPSEWGLALAVLGESGIKSLVVSIQLMSPASGDLLFTPGATNLDDLLFPFN